MKLAVIKSSVFHPSDFIKLDSLQNQNEIVIVSNTSVDWIASIYRIKDLSKGVIKLWHIQWDILEIL